jgi:hypothetical protein
MDDGTIAIRGKQILWKIATHKLTAPERDQGSGYFRRLGIAGAWDRVAHSANQFEFRASVEGSQRLTAIVSPYLALKAPSQPGQGWKHWIASPVAHGSMGLVGVPIATTRRVTLHWTRRYDITVGDTHNYLVGAGIAVGSR